MPALGSVLSASTPLSSIFANGDANKWVKALDWIMPASSKSTEFAHRPMMKRAEQRAAAQAAGQTEAGIVRQTAENVLDMGHSMLRGYAAPKANGQGIDYLKSASRVGFDVSMGVATATAGRKMFGSGGLTRDGDGNFDIAGIPFI